MSHSCCKLPPCNVCPCDPALVDLHTGLGGMRRLFASPQSIPEFLWERPACGQRRSRKVPGTMVIRAGSTEQPVPHKPLNKVFSSLPTTVFTTMTNLANEHGSVNLGQGFPDDEGPDSMKQVTFWLEQERALCVDAFLRRQSPCKFHAWCRLLYVKSLAFSSLALTDARLCSAHHEGTSHASKSPVSPPLRQLALLCRL